ncbi:hypothetical protein F4604DRAFT_1686071 [Suillus subluteus]|nr:hypothetical protein F4604DRAFT_1686071 [Suillus subluteus]
MNSFIQDSAIDLSLDLQQHYAHLLVFPQCYDSFIPAPHLPISALLDFTNLPSFDHSLTVADLHRFFTSEHCVTNDVPADFLDRSLPPLSLSTQLLNTFSQAYHDGVKSVKDPQFLGNLPFWVVHTSIDTLRDLRDLPHMDPDMWQRIQLRSTTMRINDDSVDAEVSLPEDNVVESDGVNDEAPLEVVLEHIMSDKTYVPEGYIMGTDGSLIVDGAADKHCDMISPSDSEGSVRGVGDAVTNLRSNGYSRRPTKAQRSGPAKTFVFTSGDSAKPRPEPQAPASK